jgi:hypothetical protein
VTRLVPSGAKRAHDFARVLTALGLRLQRLPLHRRARQPIPHARANPPPRDPPGVRHRIEQLSRLPVQQPRDVPQLLAAGFANGAQVRFHPGGHRLGNIDWH